MMAGGCQAAADPACAPLASANLVARGCAGGSRLCRTAVYRHMKGLTIPQLQLAVIAAKLVQLGRLQ
jgi:hypothetical protein